MQDDRITQAYLFNRGTDCMCYRLLGSRRAGAEAERGYSFAVWAPRAHSVSVVGDWNAWSPDQDRLEPLGSTGIWTGTFPAARTWNRYRYHVLGTDGSVFEKTDPMAVHCETRPSNASILYDFPEWTWHDQDFVRSRERSATAPLLIYEVHLGSWRRNADGSVLDYRTLAHQLGEYVLDMGFTHVELMPIMEHPLDDSWGYQVTGFFSVTSRFGTPDDFRFFVDHLHSLGIGVILDWVPGHFPRDAHGLARFDGTCTYEYEDPRLGEHKEWGTLVFDFGRAEVRSFLLSSAVFWMDVFHVDGLRVDAVSSMIYRNYGRNEYSPNQYGGVENLEAVAFLQEFNRVVDERFPGVLRIAEESTAWPKVTHPTEYGGLGFTHKWNMGWMHDSLDYHSRDFGYRRWHHDQMTFSMVYAFSERFILPLSHDEVVHGKLSLIGRMPGDAWRKAAALRAMYLSMYAHPGAKLLFMGAEFGQYVEWRFFESLEWFLLGFETHSGIQRFVRDLNRTYRSLPSLHEVDDSWNGFSWLSVDDAEHSAVVYLRRGKAPADCTIAALNLQTGPLDSYRIGVPAPGTYRVVMDSDAAVYGGSDYLMLRNPERTFESSSIPASGQPYSIDAVLPPLSGLLIRRMDAEHGTGGQNPPPPGR